MWPASYGGSAETYLRFYRYLFFCLGGREDKRELGTLFLCAQQSKPGLATRTGPSELCLSTDGGQIEKRYPKTSQTGQSAKFLLNNKEQKIRGARLCQGDKTLSAILDSSTQAKLLLFSAPRPFHLTSLLPCGRG